MKYFFLALLFILAVIAVDRFIVRNSPDMSKESGLRREEVKEPTKQAQEDKSVWDTQRENKNKVPRH